MPTCTYDNPWAGKCGKPADESGYCEQHKKEKCAKCGEQATHGCPMSGSLTCGTPLCATCKCPTHNV